MTRCDIQIDRAIPVEETAAGHALIQVLDPTVIGYSYTQRS